jgi:hypothetical protein
MLIFLMVRYHTFLESLRDSNSLLNIKQPVMEPNSHVQELLLEAVENQLREGNPPETAETYTRLLAEGHPDREARLLIGTIILVEMNRMARANEFFNHERFVSALRRLPELPED